MFEITLVTDEDDGHFLVCVVTHLFEPLLDDRLERESFRNVVYDEDSDCLPVVSVRDSAVAFLTCRVPDLRTD